MTGPLNVFRSVAVLLSRFPTVTETFVLREVEEMERQGRPVRLVPLIRDDPPVIHEEARPWMDRALFTPFLSPTVIAANVRALVSAPGRYLRLLGRLVAGTLSSPNFLARTLALFPKSVLLAERLIEDGIRHVHAHFATHPATMGLIVAELSEIEFSFTAHAHDIFVRRALLEEKLRGARFVRVISEFNRDYLLERYPDLDPGKVRVVHMGIRPERYRSEAPRRPGGDPPRIVCVASLRPYKGIPVLVEACRHLREAGVAFRCEIAGDGPLEEEITARIVETGLADRVRLRGALPQDQIPAFLAGADAFVLPSVVQEDGQMDGIPVALMEAMAAELPVVASRLSGIPELVEDEESGYLRTPGDAVGVADALRTLLEDPERATRMGIRGRERVESAFDVRDCAAGLIGLIEEVEDGWGPEVVARLRASGWSPLEAGTVGVRRVHRGSDAWVAELLLPESGDPLSGNGRRGMEGPPTPRELVLKVHRSRPGASRPARDRARREFEALRWLSGSRDAHAGPSRRGAPDLPEPPTPASGSRGTAPRPLYLDETTGTLVMERCRGRSLLEAIRARRFDLDPRGVAELAADVRRCGAWLRGFQLHTRRGGNTDAALDGLAARVIGDVEAFAGVAVEPEEVSRFQARAKAIRARAGDRLPPVGCHGDFWPGNVFVSGEHLEVIDFEGIGTGHPYEDPAYFLVHLALLHAIPGLGGRERRLAAAFMEGYGEDIPEGSPSLELCRMAVSARVLLRDVEHGRDRGIRGALRRRILFRRLTGAGEEA